MHGVKQMCVWQYWAWLHSHCLPSCWLYSCWKNKIIYRLQIQVIYPTFLPSPCPYWNLKGICPPAINLLLLRQRKSQYLTWWVYCCLQINRLDHLHRRLDLDPCRSLLRLVVVAGALTWDQRTLLAYMVAVWIIKSSCWSNKNLTIFLPLSNLWYSWEIRLEQFHRPLFQKCQRLDPQWHSVLRKVIINKKKTKPSNKVSVSYLFSTKPHF